MPRKMVPTYHLMMTFVAECEPVTRNEVARGMWKMAQLMRDTTDDLEIDAVFRGCLKEGSTGIITSEPVDSELYSAYFNLYLWRLDTDLFDVKYAFADVVRRQGFRLHNLKSGLVLAYWMEKDADKIVEICAQAIKEHKEWKAKGVSE